MLCCGILVPTSVSYVVSCFCRVSEAGRLRVRLGAVTVSWRHFMRLVGSPGCHPFTEILLHCTVNRAFHEIPLRYNGFLLNISHT